MHGGHEDAAITGLDETRIARSLKDVNRRRHLSHWNTLDPNLASHILLCGCVDPACGLELHPFA